MRKTPLVTGEIYHVYNRGVDKRNTFQNNADLERFFQSMQEFNSIEPIGSIYENSFAKKKNPQLGHPMSKLGLVEFIAYCINPNHYHFLLRQTSEKGIEKFMQKIGNGYTKYFNAKHKRNGVLFQGKFKSILIDSNEYLLHVSAYVNLNNKLKGLTLPLSKSSWDEYVENPSEKICKTEIILEQFKNLKEYEQFAQKSLLDIVERKKQEKELVGFE